MSDKMMKERFLVNHDMHMGPINRNLKSGDVVTWCPVNDIFTVNGNELPNDGRKKGSKEGFGTAAKALQKLAYLKPDEVTILDAVEVQGQLKPKTDTLVVFPILGCLKAACEFLGREIEWVSTTEQQTQFLELFIEHIKDVEGLDCLERKADVSVEPINEWLKEHSFNIQLDPVTDGFAVASILDVLVKWLNEAQKVSIHSDKGEFPGIKLKEGVAAYRQPELYPHPVIKIRTQSEDVVCLAVADAMPDDQFSVNWKVEQLRSIQKPYGIEGVMFPMVKYDRMVDISWIEGMRTKAGDYYIEQALQQTKFRMNEIGARAQSAVAMTLRCCSMAADNPWVVIDKPFILWIERPGIEMPLFAGVFAEDVWENPGGLD